MSYASPAKVGETIVVYALGLGAETIPFGATFFAYYLDPPPQSSLDLLTAQYALDPVYTGLVAGYPGLYQINIKVPAMPAGTRPCQNARNVNATIQHFFNPNETARICVVP